MELLRTSQNAWGQEVLLGVSFDLLWLFVAAGGVVILGHVLFKALWEPAIRRRLDGGRQR
jgi:hypothetical protein